MVDVASCFYNYDGILKISRVFPLPNLHVIPVYGFILQIHFFKWPLKALKHNNDITYVRRFHRDIMQFLYGVTHEKKKIPL